MEGLFINFTALKQKPKKKSKKQTDSYFQVGKSILSFLALQQWHLQGNDPLCEHCTPHTHTQLPVEKKEGHLNQILQLH